MEAGGVHVWCNMVGNLSRRGMCLCVALLIMEGGTGTRPPMHTKHLELSSSNFFISGERRRRRRDRED